jgi:hypothetical protein
MEGVCCRNDIPELREDSRDSTPSSGNVVFFGNLFVSHAIHYFVM